MINWRQIHGDFFEGRKTLVTGGAGFIGSHLVEALIRLGAVVTVFDDLSGGSLENLAGLNSYRFLRGSICDAALVKEATRGSEFIFHLAALGSVPRSVEQPLLFHEVNVTGTFNVLEAARSSGAARFVFAASSSAYGDAPTLPKVESMPPQPRSPYAASKVAGEAMLTAWAASYHLQTISLRYFNVFGPRQNANSAYAAVIAAFAKALLAGQRPVIYGDGEQSRDFTYVENVVQANLLAARAERLVDGPVVNVGCGRRISVNQLARDMGKLFGHSDLTPLHEPTRAGDVKHSLADLQLARAVLGYQPVMDFEPGLRQTVEWYRSVSK